MNTPAPVRIAPTLETMAAIYAMPRTEGPRSTRFAAYVARTPTEWGLVPYNPMAGDAALDAVNAFLALDAEAVALEIAQLVVQSVGCGDPIELAIAVRSKGLWTDRIATEVDERVAAKERVPYRGVITLWSREEASRDTVARETAAETVRVIWHAVHGIPDTLARVLACEGMAYAVAESHAARGEFSKANTPDETVSVIEAFEVLGDTRQAGEIAGVLYGDDVAKEMGWTPLGINPHAGYRWAVSRARDRMHTLGAAAALRAPVD